MRVSSVVIIGLLYWLSAVLSTTISPEHHIVAIDLSFGVTAASIAVFRWLTIPGILLGSLAVWLFPIVEYTPLLSEMASNMILALISIPIWQRVHKGRIVVQNRNFAIRVVLAMAFVMIPLLSIVTSAAIALELGT